MCCGLTTCPGANCFQIIVSQVRQVTVVCAVCRMGCLTDLHYITGTAEAGGCMLAGCQMQQAGLEAVYITDQDHRCHSLPSLSTVACIVQSIHKH